MKIEYENEAEVVFLDDQDVKSDEPYNLEDFLYEEWRDENIFKEGSEVII